VPKMAELGSFSFWNDFRQSSKPELELVIIGLDRTTSSCSGFNLTTDPKQAGTNLEPKLQHLRRHM
jgi:hypothetical protein